MEAMKDDPNALLIGVTELSTKMSFVLDAINKLEKVMGDRITTIEHGKMDRTEFNRIQADDLKTRMDHEVRIRDIEKKNDQLIGKESIISMIFASVISLVITVVGAFIEIHK